MDYNIVFLSDCTAAYSQEEHDISLYNMRTHFGVVASSKDVIEAWNAAPALTPA